MHSRGMTGSADIDLLSHNHPTRIPGNTGGHNAAPPPPIVAVDKMEHPGSIQIDSRGAFIVDNTYNNNSSSPGESPHREEDTSSIMNGNGSLKTMMSNTSSNHATVSSNETERSNSRGSNQSMSNTRPGMARRRSSDVESVQSLSRCDHDIALPHHTAKVSHIAVDIGGTLAKIVYFTRDSDGIGGKLSFAKFETDDIEECIDFIKNLINRESTPERNPSPSIDGDNNHKNNVVTHVMATGGGAFLFYDRLKHELHVDVGQAVEMDCLITGLDFFITQIPEEVFCYTEADPMVFVDHRMPSNREIYPYLLVNIGSGVSMVKVSGPNDFVRVGGSSLGGGTLRGLLSLLTDAQSFDEMLEMASRGDNTTVDMLVGDIYGAGIPPIGLKANTIASSFGKVCRSHLPSNNHEGPKKFNQEDICRSLLYAISNNIGQIAYLQAQRNNVEHIYFGGSFIRGHLQTMHTLSYAIHFWSKGTKQAYFLRHEGYLGAVGAFLKAQPTGWGRWERATAAAAAKGKEDKGNISSSHFNQPESIASIGGLPQTLSALH